MNTKSTFLDTSLNTCPPLQIRLAEECIFHLPLIKPAELIFLPETALCLLEATANSEEQILSTCVPQLLFLHMQFFTGP